MRIVCDIEVFYEIVYRYGVWIVFLIILEMVYEVWLNYKIFWVMCNRFNEDLRDYVCRL